MLTLENIVYYYKAQPEKMILEHLSRQFEAGKMYAILGESGSGKTTLLSLMAGLDIPTEGRILVSGEDIRHRNLNEYRRHHVSLVFQNYNLIDYLTPLENVKLGGRKDPMELLQLVGLTEKEARRNILQLSGGQQQRVAIARSIAGDAPILLADEPTGNLDESTALEIIRIFQDLAHTQRKCVIIVTHSSQLAEEADIVLLLKDGKLA
ncbi:MAG: ABC transporter ATP-binding protein [Parasporobacterium sp.]|nr:ABC transporter ATP-binding protein [Parasporobacterium sp.]